MLPDVVSISELPVSCWRSEWLLFSVKTCGGPGMWPDVPGGVEAGGGALAATGTRWIRPVKLSPLASLTVKVFSGMTVSVKCVSDFGFVLSEYFCEKTSLMSFITSGDNCAEARNEIAPEPLTDVTVPGWLTVAIGASVVRSSNT